MALQLWQLAANEFKFDGGNVNMGGNNITNLKSGGDVIDKRC